MLLLSIFFVFASWTVETVYRGSAVPPPPLAIDSLGNPYITIAKLRTLSGSGVPLFYLFLYYKINGQWLVDTFESNATGLLGECDMTIDKYNRPWCIYMGFNETDTIWYLIVAHKDTSGWKKDTVVASNDTTLPKNWYSISTDTLCMPHIAFQVQINGQGKGYYANFADTIWYYEMVDSMTEAYCCAIDIDSQNRPHISYFHLGSDLWYAKKVDGVWYCEEVEHMIQASWSTTSIRVGPDDLPGIAYKDSWTYQLKYAYYDGISWHIDTVDSEGPILTPKALDMDNVGMPFLCSGTDVYALFVYYKENGMWYKVILPPLNPPLVRQYPGALRIGRDGTIHVARLATNVDWSYREIHYIYGTIADIKEKQSQMQNLSFGLKVVPNIVNRNIQLRYTIPTRQKIDLKLYDIIGRQVVTIVDDITEPGVHVYNYDSSDLSQGVYFVIFKGEMELRTVKILVVR